METKLRAHHILYCSVKPKSARRGHYRTGLARTRNRQNVTPVLLEVLHDVAAVLARELSVIVLDVPLERHLVAEHAAAVRAGMLLGAVEVLLQG